MPDGSRIPRLISKFQPFIFISSNYLTKNNNAARLGITETEVAQWIAFANEWEPLYQLYSNKQTSRTTAIKDQLNNIIYKMVEYDRQIHLLDRIASSVNVTVEDAGVFNIKRGIYKRTHTIHKTPISEPVSVLIQPIGGGLMNIKCYSSTGKRSSIYSYADSVQYMYLMSDTPPASAEASGMIKELSTRATFILETGSANSGKYLSICLRWYNTKHPNLSGPWSALQTSLIL